MDLYKSDNRLGINTVNTYIKNGFSDLNNIKNYTNNYDLFNINGFSTRKIQSTRNKNNLNFILTKKNTINNKEETFNNNNFYYEKLSEFDFSIIRNSFSLAENSFTKGKYDMNFSGSTCICIFIIENKVICANCGDSRAILVTEDKYNVNKNLIFNLSIDHKPDLKEEASRIFKNNGRIDRHFEDGIRSGPLRVWLKNENIPGLAMTRSIGDMIASKVGVICEPEIIEYTINQNSKFIVIASDGLWEVCTNEEVSNFVNPFYASMDCESAVSYLVEEAKKKWKQVKYYFFFKVFFKFFFTIFFKFLNIFPYLFIFIIIFPER